MFVGLKDIVDIIKTAVTEYRQLKTKKEREEIVLELLKVYFLLKDCVEDAERLIGEAGKDPVGKIKDMSPADVIRTLTRWDSVLRKQGMRLYTLQGCIFGQDHLAIINPELQAKMLKVIGYKMDRAVTLHGIGAALFFRNMFDIQETNEEKARLVALMSGAGEDGMLDLEKIYGEVATLRGSLDGYRAVVERIVTNEELLALSSRAREATLLTGDT